MLRAALRRLRVRHVLVHVHLFKNAGSTVDWALARSFGTRFATVDRREDPSNVYTPEEVTSFIRENLEMDACSSHQFRPPLPRRWRIRLYPIAFVRHPIDRAFSVYNFERRQGDDASGANRAQALTVDAYLRWWFDHTRNGLVNNFHISCFGRDTPGERAESQEGAVALARRRWAALAVGGVVERFDESLTLAEFRLGKRFPALDLAYISQNVGRARTESLEERVERECAGLPEETRALLWERNREDLAFYRWAEQRLDDQIGAIPDFDQRLADFRGRCRALAAG
jgi:hypothetical protein